MEELLEIYKRIEDLRNKGVKMKDIAEKRICPPVCCLLSIQVCCHLCKIGKERNDGRRSIGLCSVSGE